MPNPTPVGGISLIAHLIINIVAFGYRHTKKHLFFMWPALEDKLSTTGMPIAKSVPIATRVFSYGIVLSMFSFFLGLSIFTFGFSSETSTLSFTTKVAKSVYLSVSKNDIFARTEEVPALEAESMADQDLRLAVADRLALSSEFDIAAVQNYDSLTDLLKDTSKNSSFEFRAALAKDLGVVADESEYEGTVAQNMELLRVIKKVMASSGGEIVSSHSAAE